MEDNRNNPLKIVCMYGDLNIFIYKHKTFTCGRGLTKIVFNFISLFSWEYVIHIQDPTEAKPI